MEPSLVITDNLTGLYNRRYANKALQENLSLAKQQGLSGAIILLDLEFFRYINNHLGHLIGDIILQKVGELLKTTFKDGGIPCRYGVNEFLIILPNTSVDLAYEHSEKLRLAIKSLDISSGQGIITLTPPLGVAGFPGQGETVESLLKVAYQALYKSMYRDQLTGLYNRRYAKEVLKENLSLA